MRASYPMNSSPAHTSTCHTLYMPLSHILHAVIPSALLSCTYCPPLYPLHASNAHTAHRHTLCMPLLHILLTIIPSACLYRTYCPLLYPMHSGKFFHLSYPLPSFPAHTAHRYTFCMPLPHILPTVISSALLFCTYFPLSYP